MPSSAGVAWRARPAYPAGMPSSRLLALPLVLAMLHAAPAAAQAPGAPRNPFGEPAARTSTSHLSLSINVSREAAGAR